MSDASDWDHWIDTVLEQGVNLSKWEEDFVRSLDDQRGNGRDLSERQAEILERIYAEKTP